METNPLETAPAPDAPQDGAAIRARITAAVLDLAATRGWARTTVADVAARAGLDLATLRRHVADRAGLALIVLAHHDEAVLADGDPDPSGGARDRLFDLLMRRYDRLQANRAGVRPLLRGVLVDPPVALAAGLAFGSSMAWMLEAAGIPSAGLTGRARAAALGALHLDTLRVWLSDDSPDMAKTMRALDRRLDRLAGWWRAPGMERASQPAPAAADAPSPPPTTSEIDPAGG